MTQEDKALLLKDLCARLPYGIKAGTTDNDGSLENVWDILWYNTFANNVELMHCIEDDSKLIDISEVKPYLLPLSSMTEEQSKVYHELINGMFGTSALINFEVLTDFFNSNHLDYRGLIKRGLAIDATGLNIY